MFVELMLSVVLCFGGVLCFAVVDWAWICCCCLVVFLVGFVYTCVCVCCLVLCVF